ncbi:Peptidyl-prolyl cis-trans isomerase CWC27 like protein [Eufriesea mexicana]|uniref:Spliceosome-associated protein CWC27 homolog n=1 Tax=Eufriesea mexicana TaxID=516756 RepID=A0A310SBC2_9HYME|nr:Peptidyl-prolyl cis-trans isomerase CWC27 like protein [Eufriesea mexicana]
MFQLKNHEYEVNTKLQIERASGRVQKEGNGPEAPVGVFASTIRRLTSHKATEEFVETTEFRDGAEKRKGEAGVNWFVDRTNEFYTGLRFCQRDLIAMSNAAKDDNTSQFLFTLGSTSELQNKHTIFGKVTEETIYNMLKLKKAPVDENDRPLYAPKMIKTIILNYPFSDIIPRIIVQESEEVKDSSKTKTARVKDFNFLSFGGEAEEDNEESVILNKKFRGKCDEGKDKNKLMDAKKKPKIVENYKINDVEDDKDIKKNE